MREAACHCGDLRVECEGEALLIAMCHCGLCQRRTGSSNSLGAWFPRRAVTVSGTVQVYERPGGDTGEPLQFHFCPRCGSSVLWETPEGELSEMLAVAVGCFFDPSFPEPTLSVYAKSRHEWLPRLAGIPSFDTSTEGDRE